MDKNTEVSAKNLINTAKIVAEEIKEVAATNADNDAIAMRLIKTAEVVAEQLKKTAEAIAKKLKGDSTADINTEEIALHLKETANTVAEKVIEVAEIAAKKLSEVNNIIKIQEAMFDSIPEGVYVTDINGRITFFNRQITILLGPQIVGELIEERQKDYGFFLPDQTTLWPADQLPLIRTKRNGIANGGIMFIRNKYKPEGIWITNYAYPLKNTEGKTIGVVAILKEIIQTSGLPAFGMDVPAHPL